MTSAVRRPTPPRRRKPRRAALRGRVITVGGMTAFWMLLWGDISWGNLFGGLAVVLMVMTVFPLPDVGLHGRIRPWAALVFLIYFVRDLIVSSVQVAWAAIRPRGVLRNAVIAVKLRVHSDLNLTFTGVALTLIPGSLIVDARRDTATLYIHVLDVKDLDDVERFRRKAFELEARIIRAFGTDDDVRTVDLAEGKVVST